MTNPSTNTQKWDWSQVVKIAVGAVAFGVLMSVRAEADQIWARAALGAAVLSAVGRKN